MEQMGDAVHKMNTDLEHYEKMSDFFFKFNVGKDSNSLHNST